MFVWSEAQARMLLGAPPAPATAAQDEGYTCHQEFAGCSSREEDVEAAEASVERDLWVGRRLLDLGAGDGYVTQVLGAGAANVDVTETSGVMRGRLRGRGYR